LLATAWSLDRGRDWVVVTPEGFFDGSSRAMGTIMKWRVDTVAPLEVDSGKVQAGVPPQAPVDVNLLPLEHYFSDFYHPGILSDVIRQARPLREILRSRGDPRADLRLADRDRRLPTVRIEAPRTTASRSTEVVIRVSRGARDLRLYRNGVLAARWAGAITKPLVTARITAVAGDNVLTAYAFNADNVKSVDAVARMGGDRSLARAPQAHVLCIGINAYRDATHALKFAVADATDTADALRGSLPFAPDAIQVRTLLDAGATREGILKALEALAVESQPEDTVVILYSGHGVLEGGRFVLIPQDMGRISDADLERLLLPVQARHVALILDACHSGQALASDDWRRGPLNARGLVQLAWEKGMDLLAASQSAQTAQETWQIGDRPIGHGLLTFALIEEGLKAGQAPRRGNTLWARDWMQYAVGRVPGLLGGTDLRGRDLKVTGNERQSGQIPVLFHRREPDTDWPVHN